MHFSHFHWIQRHALLLSIITISFVSVIDIAPRYYFSAEEGSNAPIMASGSLLTAHIWSLPAPQYAVTLKGTFTAGSTRNLWTLQIPRELRDDIVSIEWAINGERYHTDIDEDGDERDMAKPFVTSFPVLSASALQASYEITLRNAPLKTPDVHIVAIDTEAHSMRIAFNPMKWLPTVNADGIRIISRREWGADEELRYDDSTVWKSIYARQAAEALKNPPKPTTEPSRTAQISAYLRTNFADEENPITLIRSENGRPLRWNIAHTKAVKKIVVHHTAENNTRNSDDLTLIRGIYYYHTIVRGWWDIGYNYLVGQRGALYEGRAGGKYVVAAHAVWNNASTVGVALLGNFVDARMNRDQRAGLESILKYLVDLYGINVNAQVNAHRECTGKQSCLINDFKTSALVGHTDVGYTSCPGENVISELPEIRAMLAKNPPSSLVLNPTKPQIQIASNSTTTKSTTLTSRVNTPSLIGPKIRILLSYQGTGATFSSAIGPRLDIATKNATGALKTLKVRAIGNRVSLTIGRKRVLAESVRLSSSVVRVNSWNRKPTWDTSNTYNDNLFRGTIEVRAQSWSLTLINELPIEAYLIGLGEVSNSEPTEKLKALAIAGRSYALWYTDPNNRKFPGKPYDGSDDPNVFQRYLGYGYESRSPNYVAAVQATLGDIVTYSGALVKTWYFSASTGKTKSYREYCEGNKIENCQNIPYLQSVEDFGSTGLTPAGHGVGLSGAWANYFAQVKKWNAQQILEYYYTGAKVQKASYIINKKQ